MTVLVSAVTAAAVAALALTAGGRPTAPHVTATSPVAGARVASGPLMLGVRFDRPMLAGGWSFIRVDARTFPDCAAAPVQSADGRSFRLACVVRPHSRYEVGFNSAGHHNFVSADGQVPATPSKLTFSTR